MERSKQTKLASFASVDQPCFVRIFDATVCRDLVAKDVNSKINVFCGSVRKAIIGCPGRPTALELEKSQDGQCQIWVATHTGSVYRKALTFHPSTNIESMEVDDGSNQSIFDDLLSNTGSAFEHFDVPKCKSPENPSEICNKDRELSYNGEVISISSTKDFLALVCKDEDGTSVLIYPMSASLLQNYNNFAQKLLLPFHRQSSQGQRFSNQLSSFHIVTSCDMSQCLSSSQITIPLHLFASLFGWESSVRTLPVLLCGLQDGSVYFLPVDISTSNPELSWQLLCAVDSPVIDIFSVKLNRTLSEKESVAVELQRSLGLAILEPSHSLLDAVIIVGVSGKCCLMTVMPALGSKTADRFRVASVFTLPSSVQCVCCRDQTLFISSGQCIQKCSLTLLREEECEQKRYRVEVKSEILHSASVSSMWLSLSGGNQEGAVTCETANGDLVEFGMSAPATVGDYVSEQLQPSLKDLLLGVDISQAKVKELQSQQEQFNALLQQINVASHLLHVGHPHTTASQGAALVSCKVTVQSDVGYHAVDYHLVVLVTNHSSVALTNSWSLVATLLEVDCPDNLPAPKTHTSLQTMTPSSHTLKLSQGLGAGQMVHFRIPMPYSATYPGLSVNISLMLHIPESLQGNMKDLEAVPGCLVIPLAATVVDVFHFLHLKQPGCVLPQAADPVSSLEDRVAELGHSHQNGRRTELNQSYSMSHCVAAKSLSSSSLVDILRTLLNDSQVDLNQLTHPSCTLQVSCGSLLSVAVEARADDLSLDDASGTGKPYVFVIKSSDISLLARARLALTRRVKNIGRSQSDGHVEEFQKLISTVEVLQKQLQGIEEKMAKENGSSSTDTVTQLCALYETMRSSTV